MPLRWLIDGFELDGCEHAKRGVWALAVVEGLEVLEDRVGQLDSDGEPLPPERARRAEHARRGYLARQALIKSARARRVDSKV